MGSWFPPDPLRRSSPALNITSIAEHNSVTKTAFVYWCNHRATREIEASKPRVFINRTFQLKHTCTRTLVWNTADGVSGDSSPRPQVFYNLNFAVNAKCWAV